MRFFRPFFIDSCLYPEALFRISTTEKILCLTFDDGPDPESTSLLLDILGRHSIKALFFCTGKAAENYPDLIRKIISNGHLIGNHGYSHPDGWNISPGNYLSDIAAAAPFTSSNIFRPPYGHLRVSQYRKLKETYKIFFWDLMPYDFDTGFGPRESLNILKKRIRPGSIIVLHDTNKSTCQVFLEEFIVSAKEKGYSFELPFKS